MGAISFWSSFLYGLIVVAAFVVGCFVGANSPEWFSQRAKDAKKFIEDTKTKEGRQQIVDDTIAEMKRQKLLKE
jgi:hypothetical protein